MRKMGKICIETHCWTVGPNPLLSEPHTQYLLLTFSAFMVLVQLHKFFVKNNIYTVESHVKAQFVISILIGITHNSNSSPVY